MDASQARDAPAGATGDPLVAGERTVPVERTVTAAQRRRALATVSRSLRCPVCAGSVGLEAGQVACGRGHRFDIARQGYVNLRAGGSGAGTGDSAAMVTSREEFLRHGHYEPLADAIAEAAAWHTPRHRTPGVVVDLAGGTGYYLAAVLDALPTRYGACLDLSVPALRRAARAHSRAAAIGADAWRPLPLADGAASLLLSVFGPRNPAEITRVLAPGGTLIIASPGAGHLGELREPLGTIGVDERKDQRIADAYGDYDQAGDSRVNYRLSLDHDGIAAGVGMGPSARHITPQTLTARIRGLPPMVIVTVDVQVRVLRRPLLPARLRRDRRLIRTAGPAQGGPDRDRALRDELDHRPEVLPPVRNRPVAASPGATVAARLVERAGQRADRAQQLGAGRAAQPRQHRVDLGQQPGDRPEAALQLRADLAAAHLAHASRRQVSGVGEVGREADHRIIRVPAAGAEFQGGAHSPAVRVQPLRPGQPVTVLVLVLAVVLAVKQVVIVVQFVVEIRILDHDAPEFTGLQA